VAAVVLNARGRATRAKALAPRRVNSDFFRCMEHADGGWQTYCVNVSRWMNWPFCGVVLPTKISGNGRANLRMAYTNSASSCFDLGIGESRFISEFSSMMSDGVFRCSEALQLIAYVAGNGITRAGDTGQAPPNAMPWYCSARSLRL